MELPEGVSEDRRAPYRPTMITEVRAWLVVAGAFLLNVIVVVYWAATLSSKVEGFQTQLTEFKQGSSTSYSATQANKDFADVYRQLNDHENRLREGERNRLPLRR